MTTDTATKPKGLIKKAPAATTAPAADTTPPAPAMKISKNAKPAAVADPVVAGLVAAVADPVVATPAAVETSEAPSIAPEDQIFLIAQEIETAKEDKAFALVPKLMEDIDRNHFRIGGLLSRINSEGWYQDKGYETFRSFIEAVYGLKYRKANYLINNYKALLTAGIPWEKVKHLGWTKLSEVAKYLTLENVDEWMAAIEGMTVDQIIAYVAKVTKAPAIAGSTDAVVAATQVTSMTFKLHQDQKATVREALNKCKHETGTEHDSVALEYICIDFLGGAAKQPVLKDLMQTKSVEEVLSALQEAFPTLTLEVGVPE